MPLSAEDLYKTHVLNLRAVGDGLARIERELNSAIASQDAAKDTLIRIFLLLAGAWTECRLRKVLYESSGFGPSDRQIIEGQRTQADRWRRALELGYRKRYNVRRIAISEHSVGATAWLRYEAIDRLIKDELEPLIEMRNTLAHGQWVRPLNSDETDLQVPMLVALKRENALSIKFKLTLSTHIAELIHDLVAATSFERDFDRHYQGITSTRLNLRERSYEDWERRMIEKYKRGRVRRNEAIKSQA